MQASTVIVMLCSAPIKESLNKMTETVKNQLCHLMKCIMMYLEIPSMISTTSCLLLQHNLLSRSDINSKHPLIASLSCHMKDNSNSSSRRFPNKHKKQDNKSKTNQPTPTMKKHILHRKLLSQIINKMKKSSEMKPYQLMIFKETTLLKITTRSSIPIPIPITSTMIPMKIKKIKILCH